MRCVTFPLRRRIRSSKVTSKKTGDCPRSDNLLRSSSDCHPCQPNCCSINWHHLCITYTKQLCFGGRTSVEATSQRRYSCCCGACDGPTSSSSFRLPPFAHLSSGISGSPIDLRAHQQQDRPLSESPPGPFLGLSHRVRFVAHTLSWSRSASDSFARCLNCSPPPLRNLQVLDGAARLASFARSTTRAHNSRRLHLPRTEEASQPAFDVENKALLCSPSAARNGPLICARALSGAPPSTSCTPPESKASVEVSH